LTRAGGADVSGRRARVVLLLADGASYADITRIIGWSSATTAKWKQRFVERRVAGLEGRHQGSHPRRLTPPVEALVLSRSRRPPTDGSIHWSTRSLARELGLSHTMVGRVWRRAGVHPRRLARYMEASDVNFKGNTADVIGLTLQPTQHAAVFCSVEKASNAAIERLNCAPPRPPGHAASNRVEQDRQATSLLCAALEARTGNLNGRTAPCDANEELVGFLTEVVATQPRAWRLDAILDNLATLKSKLMQAFLAAHRSVHLHFTPTFSSWLHQVEFVLSKIERDPIAGEVLVSAEDFGRRIRRAMTQCNRRSEPFRWVYASPTPGPA
jgi:transposase